MSLCGSGSLHKKDWLKIAGGLALGATGLGAAGIGPLSGLGGLLGNGAAAGVGAGAGAATDASLGAAGLLNAAELGGVGAGVGALTDASLGAAGLMNSVSPQSTGLLSTLSGALKSPTGQAVGKGLQAFSNAEKAMQSAGAGSPQGPAPMQPMKPAAPPVPLPVASDPPPTTPFSEFDPIWSQWLKRHPQGAAHG